MTTIKSLALVALVATALPAFGAPKDPPAKPIEKAVRERTGLEVRWQQDAAAREAALADVRTLLKKPLTVNSAVQIALLNNRELLATFEDVGVSAADLREAGLWKNPSIDLSVRFPDRPPSAANWEEAAALICSTCSCFRCASALPPIISPRRNSAWRTRRCGSSPT